MYKNPENLPKPNPTRPFNLSNYKQKPQNLSSIAEKPTQTLKQNDYQILKFYHKNPPIHKTPKYPIEISPIEHELN